MHSRPLELNDKSDSKLIHQTLFGLDLEVDKQNKKLSLKLNLDIFSESTESSTFKILHGHRQLKTRLSANKDYENEFSRGGQKQPTKVSLLKCFQKVFNYSSILHNLLHIIRKGEAVNVVGASQRRGHLLVESSNGKKKSPLL